MIIDIQEERMLIISDLHIGNPFCDIKKDLVSFLNEAIDKGYSVCINGDGIDVMQTSLPTLTNELPVLLAALRRFKEKGLSLYYVVGNHDLVFEKFLTSTSHFAFSPFLNLESGGKRIRIEHGFLYDKNFVKNPQVYEFFVHLGGYFLKILPAFYRLWIFYENIKNGKNRKNTQHQGINGEAPEFAKAAQVILQRGFDSVVFGHTHHSGHVELEQDQHYYNSGSFMLSYHYIKIENGEAELALWEKGSI
ncbi:metallophosphoesterase [Magnetovibrio sp. PR-2]|uniref:UDP-2,3-diacylglucosamine diphosphatase n=1 Tax=Magnetovibrio sp. PR-2 TaxID=3120356 RepID=UPI002FCE55C8